MAYRDIEMWRSILESEDRQKKEYDEACAKRNAEAEALDEKDFWECDQKEIDPNTLAEVASEGAVNLEDVEDVDEDIDFSGYMDECDDLDESDMREPLTAVSTALGAPASTANLTGQDTVKLAEAINRLAGILEGKKQDEDENKKSGKKKEKEKEKEIAEADVEDLKEIDGLPLTDADWDKVDALDTVIDKVEFVQRKCEGKKLSKKAQEELDATIDNLVKDAGNQQRGSESKKALKAAKDFYEQWLDDPDFRERAALRDKDGAVVKKPAGWYKTNPETGKREVVPAGTEGAKKSRGEVIAGTDPNSELAQRFKSYFDKMSPEDRDDFAKWAAERQSRFTTKQFAPVASKNGLKRGDLHGKDGEDDENVNPLTQHGFDQTFVAANDDADINAIDDPEAGDEFYTQFDQNRSSTISHEDIVKEVKHITDICTDWAKKQGLTLDELTKKLQDDKRLDQVVQTYVDKGVKAEFERRKKPGERPLDFADWRIAFTFTALSPEQQDELKNELKQEAGGNRLELRFIDYLFRFGKNRKFTQEDFNFLYGIAGDQSGSTGNGTQYDDRHLGMLVAALGRYFEIDEEETSELLRTCYSQNASKTDKERGIEPRRYSRHLLCKILQELYDGFHDNNTPHVVVPQSPAIGPGDGKKITGKDWDTVKKLVAGFCCLLRLRMKPAELREVAKEIENVFEQKYGTFDADGNMLTTGTARVRKMVTRLSRKQNDEYQQLIDDLRQNFPDMDDEDKIRFLQLDYMRFGKGEDQAENMARRDMEKKVQHGGQKEFDDYVILRMKAFLAGGSNNVNKDDVAGVDVKLDGQ